MRNRETGYDRSRSARIARTRRKGYALTDSKRVVVGISLSMDHSKEGIALSACTNSSMLRERLNMHHLYIYCPRWCEAELYKCLFFRMGGSIKESANLLTCCWPIESPLSVWFFQCNAEKVRLFLDSIFLGCFSGPWFATIYIKQNKHKYILNYHIIFVNNISLLPNQSSSCTAYFAPRYRKMSCYHYFIIFITLFAMMDRRTPQRDPSCGHSTTRSRRQRVSIYVLRAHAQPRWRTNKNVSAHQSYNRVVDTRCWKFECARHTIRATTVQQPFDIIIIRNAAVVGRERCHDVARAHLDLHLTSHRAAPKAHMCVARVLYCLRDIARKHIYIMCVSECVCSWALW